MTDDEDAGAGSGQPEVGFAAATIYLADAGIDQIGDLIKPGEAADEFDLDPALGVEGRIYVQQHVPRAPEWVAGLATLATQTMPDITTQLAGAALLVRLGGRLFAFTFGQGRHLLRPDRLVDDFGLRVAANTVDPTAIRSLDGRTFERGVLLTRRQASRPGRVEALGLQVDREMLRSITGKARAAGGGRVHGSTSLGLTREIDLRRLEDFGRELLVSYAATDYQEAFAQLDNMRALAPDSAEARRLDERLVEAIRDPDHHGAYLAAPAILDWGDVSGFRFNLDGRAERRDDAVMGDYLQLRPAPTSDDLRADEVRGIDRDALRVIHRWPILRWIVWETELDGRAFVLSDGRWWRVDEAYLDAVNAAVARIGRASVTPPVPSHPRLREDLYNAEAAAALGGILLDKKLARVKTERGGFELCDVFVPPDRFLHVKRGIGSQELTYLFSQGVMSAEGFRNAREVRARLQQLLRDADPVLATMIPVEEKPAAGAFEVVYVVVDAAAARVPRQIPFFARAALAREVRRLEELDMRYSAVGVPTTAGRTPASP